jgi:hypothetical protein
MLFKIFSICAPRNDKSDCSLVDLDSVLQTVADEFCDLGHHVTYHGGGRKWSSDPLRCAAHFHQSRRKRDASREP